MQLFTLIQLQFQRNMTCISTYIYSLPIIYSNSRSILKMADNFVAACKHAAEALLLSPLQRLLFFKKPRKRGKGGKKGKAEKRERRKKRERKGKAKKASARFLSKYGKSCRYPTAHSLSAG